MKNNPIKILELADLQAMLLHTCNYLNRPVRKSQLIKMVTELFECNTPKQAEFALLDLIEQGSLFQKGCFIATPEFASSWDGTVTAADEQIIKFLLSLKEEAKHYIFFDVFAKEPLAPSCFFQYIKKKYPALLHRNDTAFVYMEQMEKAFPYGLNNDFYAEMNDYPVEERWLTAFFNNPDCRIFIKNMDFSKKHINIQVVLLPGKKRSYRKAQAQFEEFEQHMPLYFHSDMNVHITKSLTSFTGSRKRKNRESI